MRLKNGFMINPRTNEEHVTDIRVSDGTIKEIGALTPQENEEVC